MDRTKAQQIKEEAIEKIIFQGTPRAWLKEHGPWLLERGRGAYLFDSEGRQFLDVMSGGVFAVLAGYGREEIARAMYEQAKELNYTSPYAGTSVVAVELARKLAELMPGQLSASFFTNSGSEAIESSMKLAHQYHQANGQGRRYKVVSLRRAYHGATAGALSATGWSPNFGAFRRAADPVVPVAGSANAMPPYCYRCELKLQYPDCLLACATTIEQAIIGSDPELVSAVIVEPIMGTAGVIVPPAGYLARVREICDRYGILLIADEVVCGFGRTGRWFGVDHFHVVPDIVAIAKGLTSGYAPMGAAVVRREIAEKIPVFFDVHTMGGNPVSAAAALANIQLIEHEGLVENSARVGAYMLQALQPLRAHPTVGDIRGLGLFIAVELQIPDDAGAAPTVKLADEVGSAAMGMGLFGPRALGGSTLAIAPPLIFTKDQADHAVEVLDAALSKVEDGINLHPQRQPEAVPVTT